MKKRIVTAGIVAGLTIAASGAVIADGKKPMSYYKAGDMYSGYMVTTPATRAIQDDDLQNPSFLWVDQGQELWSKADGEANKSCANCHNEAAKSMKGVGATYPKFDKTANKVINLEQRINICRTNNQKAKAWKYESDQLLGMTGYVRMQSRGMKVNVSIDGPAKAVYDKGKKFYETRRGLMDMACTNCHVDNAGKMARADLLSQGQINGFPTYRLKWQKLGSAHRRFRGCNDQIRAERLPYGSDEYIALELYLAHKGNGLRIETPSVRR
jgi:sulfur-oxidizing protein SoxA